MASDNTESSVPQWKKDLIQRRRQQNKQTSNGVFVENNSNLNQCIDVSKSARIVEKNVVVQVVGGLVPRGSASGDTTPQSVSLLATGVTPVACNMRLEADASFCLPSEDPPKLSRRTHHFENEDCRSYSARKVSQNTDKDFDNLCVFTEFRKSRIDNSNGKSMSGNGKIGEECESDSSEELQYGPGIVNKLKSKYLNLTLRESNKTRLTVQRFRKAASLEDLLDCEDDAEKINTRKFAKKTSPSSGVAAKTDRYRNATRGNESMKRARSVETLMRYQSLDDGNKTVVAKQEPVNDHIVLIDRTAVKIESRLMEERPKALNKPKRLKPLLAETERPPPDLVKTTMRLFEGSVKKLKPKGEVAVKVATFKTINDTFKAQTMKKVVPKPPILPKPFVNGANKAPVSPKKNILSVKSTAEIIERADVLEEYKNESVVTEPIVQSVSSVVSKFQQIEKSHSPSPSPEPTAHIKLKFSPTPSPEPPLTKFKDITAKSPPLIVSLPTSPQKEIPRQNSYSTNQPESPVKEFLRQTPTPEPEKLTLPLVATEEIFQDEMELSLPLNEITIEEEELKLQVDDDNISETVDGLKKISKAALENISKAGSTIEFNFNRESTSKKSYLPSVMQNGQSTRLKLSTNGVETNTEKVESNSSSLEAEEVVPDVMTRIQERLDSEKEVEIKEQLEKKPIGAISSLGIIKTSYSQVNDSKTPKFQKSEILPPQKQIGIIRPLVSIKTQMPQQNLSNRELEKNLINRVKSIEQPTKVVVSLKTADEVKKSSSGSGGGLWDSKPWNQQSNTMVFNFSNRKDVPDYIENDGLIIKRKREKPKVGDGGVIVLDSTLDVSTTDDSDWEISGGPPSPCDVSFLNDNILINGRSNLSRTPKNHKHRIQFDDAATKTFEYPSEASMLEDEGSSVDGETSASTSEQQPSAIIANKSASTNPILGGGGLASYTPSKVDLTSDGFELGVTRALPSTPQPMSPEKSIEKDNECLKSPEDTAAWGAKATADLLY